MYTTKLSPTAPAELGQSAAEFKLPEAAKLPKAAAKPKVRPLKLIAAAAVIAIGAAAIFSEQGYVVSDNAVVSAYVVALRAPIEGEVSGVGRGVGTPVDPGTVLASLDNPRADNGVTLDLQERIARLDADRAAGHALRAKLLALRETLSGRMDAYTGAVVARYSAGVAEAEQALAGLALQRDQAARDLARRAALIDSGFAPRAEVERLRSELALAESGIAAQQQRIAAARIQALAAAQGVQVEPGSNDVVYSAQRRDEVDMRLAELDRALAAGDSEHATVLRRLEAARTHDALMRRASLIAPSPAMLWKQRATDGERLAPGDVAAELVDCGAAFLLVALPQDRFSDVEIGMTARFRLSGERTERTGLVQSVSGEASLAADRNLAAAPLGQAGSTATARVAVPGSPNVAGECLVGRTARVLLPTTGEGLIARLFRRIF